MLPVVVDSSRRLRDDRPFHLQLTLDALNYKFMQLGEGDQAADASRQAWDNMGMLPWYQPVKWKHPLATVLAEHPTDMTADGKTHQPLIAIREFPSGGKVVYLGFDETWRLRRKYGEQYYRQFWGQMIQHIGLSNHIGLGQAIRREDRQAAIQARRPGAAHGAGLRRELRAAHGRQAARSESDRRSARPGPLRGRAPPNRKRSASRSSRRACSRSNSPCLPAAVIGCE